jgi:NurA-like 5'-3' nuclease
LDPGHCSGLYRTNPAAAQEYYGEQQVYFYYLNSGEEIARVEIPQWVASNQEMLALGRSMILEQCRKGQGYPVAISEAHEQAVINSLDRQLFKQMLIETLERHGLPTYTSEKERSKSSPWL